MSQDDESGSDGPGEVDPQATRVDLDDAGHPADSKDDAAASSSADAATGVEVAAETVLADVTDLAESAARPSPSDPDATEFIDPDLSFDGRSGSLESAAHAAGVAATRVLAPPDDKTSPPGVEPLPRGVAEAPRSAPAAAPAPPTAIQEGLAPGSVLFGEYEIVNVLGVGGMGEVYRARHRRLDEYRAIKVMHAEISKKKGASEFFYREAKALLAVRHPAVVHCHDLLSDDAGHVYLIMEMIEGVSLSERMSRGPLSPDEVAVLGARVAHGLSAAHRKGVIHRDVSPDNIVLPAGNVREAKVIDFGIAKLLEEGEGTILDGFKGKLSYASPEQLGFHGGRVDGRSDFYSLGLVLVAAALGRPMSMGTSVMEAVDARRALSDLPDEIPVGLRSAIRPLLALDPNDRPKYVDRLFAVPGGVEGGEEGTSRGFGASGSHASEAPRASQSATAPPRAGWLATVVIAGLLLAGGAAYWSIGIGPGSDSAIDDSSARIAPAEAEETDAAKGAEPILVGKESSALVGTDPQGTAAADAAAVAAASAKAAAEAAAAAVPAKPKVRRPSASERLRIIGLLDNARLALADGRLMSPSGDNAYDRYRSVLRLDPLNRTAKAGLRSVATAYVSMANDAIDSGDPSAAQDYLGKARKADSRAPGLASAQGRLR